MGGTPPGPHEGWADFYGPNAAYVLDLYERYVADAGSVAPEIRDAFERWGPPPATEGALEAARATGAPVAKAEGVVALIAAVGQLATAIREYGHLAAQLDPLGTPPPGDADLSLEAHGLTEADLERLPANAIGQTAAEVSGTARDAIETLRRIYCDTTGYDFHHVQNAVERAWLQEAVESGRFRPPKDPINELALLDRLSEVGAFERFLHRTFPGQTRFSIEGTGMLIPMMDEIIGAAAEVGTRALLVGMAHRGRLNVLAHVLRKPHVEILAEFKQPAARGGVSHSGSSGEAFSGDVKYHLGARRAFTNGRQVEMNVTLVPNPSHLEFVDPVVEGMARAADERRTQPGPPIQDERTSLPFLIHGDGSFPGEGVVAETLNLSRLPGYRTGGTIHLIINNQLAFTVEPANGRSTMYASDLAKGFEIPIIHVNADDPVASIAASRLAHCYRERFHKDVLIDLVGYRRWGHNEGDDPSFTQPLMYAAIAKHPTVRELFAADLVKRGVVTQQQVDERLAAHTAQLQEAMAQVNAQQEVAAQPPVEPEHLQQASAAGRNGAPQAGHEDANGAASSAEPPTGMALGALKAINEALYTLPERFTLHPRIERPMQRRRAAFEAGTTEAGEGTVDWGQAETLAFGTLLAEGVPIRLTGQDTARGTFSQRHAVLNDYKTGDEYTPLQRLPQARASFEVWDSPLSETAVLGFEYGYSVQAPDALTLWEAQYGDFVNVAEVIVDQFIVSARTKWGQTPSLVLLLPHAYEGQGPEHSSARLERFLEMAAEDNVRIVNCTTAAQYFHLLRRQAHTLSTAPRPLIVMTPKSLLRHPLAASLPAAFDEGTRFQPVLDDPFFDARALARAQVRRVILCSGKVYADLAGAEARAGAETLTILRLEQLYPFPQRELVQALRQYRAAEEVVWVQEEPQNMGAWRFVEPRLRALLAPSGAALRYAGRPERASPSEGTPSWHTAEQARIVAEAFEGVAAAKRATQRAGRGKHNGAEASGARARGRGK